MLLSAMRTRTAWKSYGARITQRQNWFLFEIEQ
jgi:hypothetical protein